jgi:hypothetical protein
MNGLSDIILKSGLLNENTIREFQRWGMPVPTPEPRGEYEAEPTPEAISRAIADAIEGEGMVLVRETDLEAIPRFLQGMKDAVLHVVTDGQEHDIDVKASFEKNVWTMPWRSESITDMLTNGETYLRVEGKRYYFRDARDLFYGQQKAFVVCTVSTEEADEDR